MRLNQLSQHNMDKKAREKETKFQKSKDLFFRFLKKIDEMDRLFKEFQ